MPPTIYLGNFVSEGSGGLSVPRDNVFGPDRNGDSIEELYVISAQTDEILVYDGTTGDFIEPFISGVPELDNPGDIAFSPVDGYLYVTSAYDTSRIFRFNGQTGAFIDAQVTGTIKPLGLTFIESGPDAGDLLIADRGTHEIVRFDGTSTTPFVTPASGGLNNPRNAVFGFDGDLYVASNGTNQILKYDGSTGDFLDFVATDVLASAAWIQSGDDGYLYLAGRTPVDPNDDQSIARIDPSTGTVDQVITTDLGWSFMVDTNGVIYNSGNAAGNVVDLFGPGSVASFEVTLSHEVAVPITLDFSTLDGTADSGDYQSVGGSLTINPGIVSRSIIVVTNDDSEFEPNEDFHLVISNPSVGTLADGTGVGTIVSDDAPPPSEPPVADDDSYVASEDEALIVSGPGVLDGDSDPESDPLTAVLVDGASHGSVNLSADGSFTYAPDPNFYGQDSFTYVASDGANDSNLATVTIDVTPVNDAPVASTESYSVEQDTPLTVPAPGVLGNDSDVDGDSLSAVAWSGSSSQGGQVVLNHDGSFSYTPPTGFAGTDSFDYNASDGSLESDPVTVSIEVSAANENAIYVDDIRFESFWGNRYWRAVFQIRSDSNANGIADPGDAPVAGVAVTVEFAGRTYSGTTDSNGIFNTSWLRLGGGNYYANAVDLALTDYAWNPLDLDREDDSDGDGRPDDLLSR